jgi:hypothetical protein
VFEHEKDDPPLGFVEQVYSPTALEFGRAGQPDDCLDAGHGAVQLLDGKACAVLHFRLLPDQPRSAERGTSGQTRQTHASLMPGDGRASQNPLYLEAFQHVA